MARQSGSMTALGGFRNETQIADDFNARNSFAIACLSYMGVSPSATITAMTVPAHLGGKSAKRLLALPKIPKGIDLRSITERQKADILLRIEENDRQSFVTLSLKKTNAKSNFNQVDKRTVDVYQALWGFDNDIRLWLKVFTGAASVSEFNWHTKDLTVDKHRRRVCFRHLPNKVKQKLLDFLDAHKRTIVTDVLQGRGPLAAQYVIVTQHAEKTMRVHLCKMDKVLDYILAEPIVEGPRSSVRLGRLTMQRYGGSPHPELLQFKIKPCELFNVEGLTQTV